MWRRHSLNALLFVALAAGVVAACDLTTTSSLTPGATSCGGSHAWPPIAYASVPPPPAGVTIGLTGPDDVTVHNASSQAWRFRIERWVDAICVGYVAEAPIDSGAITPGHLVEANIDPAEASGGGIDDVRIG